MSPSGEVERQVRILVSRTVEVISEEELRAKLERALRTGTPLRVKLGLDPTAPDLHIGHMVVVQKLRQFQELGHQVIFLIGDFTGLIGDPSGRSETRKPLSPAEIRKNAETYQRQIFKILDPAKTVIDFNSRWLSALGVEGLLRLAAQHTVARLLERDDFQQRFRSEQPIGIHELLYPLLQGYDSVALQADVELGGTDQKFNLLIGRELQRDHGQAPQVILTTPILEGLDGVQKMSKSLGNYIGIDEPPREIYGKAMSIPDGLIERYLALGTGLPDEELDRVRSGLADGSLHPRDAKARLAYELVRTYHSASAAEAAAAEFDRVFRRHEAPDEAPELLPPPEAVREGRAWLPRLLVLAGMATSLSEARRLVRQGGVAVDGEVVKDEDLGVPVDRPHLIRAGRRRYVRVLPAAPGPWPPQRPL
jgi:tyrosyl-tRNA synthetase